MGQFGDRWTTCHSPGLQQGRQGHHEDESKENERAHSQ